ncbi:MAG: serine/threonine-protein phosphatase [Oscillospiraceae bacterium]|nr:serine/threonine-protein phosphatase [Oscillospiraceae bacterium]
MAKKFSEKHVLLKRLLLLLMALTLIVGTLSIGVSADETEENTTDAAVVEETDGIVSEDDTTKVTDDGSISEGTTSEDSTSEEENTENTESDSTTNEDNTENGDNSSDNDINGGSKFDIDDNSDNNSDNNNSDTSSGTTGGDSNAEEKSGLSVATIILIVICAVFAVVIVVLIVCIALRNDKDKKAKAKSKEPESYLAVPRIGKLHDQGKRNAQQDSFTVSPPDAASGMGVLAVVADGMGGLEDGDKVSQKVVETALNTFVANAGEKFEPLMWKIVLESNKAVNKMLGPSKLYKSGSTMVAGLIRQGKFMWFSVGDSRIYLWRDGSLIQLNREHIYRHDLEIKAVNGNGTIEDAFKAKEASGLTSFFGMGDLKYVDMPATPLDIHAKDKYILMSDGVYNALTSEELIACISGAKTAEEVADELGKAVAAKAYSNQDNYTAVVLEV